MSPKKRKATECDPVISKRLATNAIQQQEQDPPPQRDFIGECAYEIMCNVLYRLDFETISECLHVSRTWKHRVSSVPDIWRKIEFTPRDPWLDRQPLAAFSFMSEYVEEIYFGGLPEYLAVCIEALKIHKLPKLYSLKLISNSSPSRNKTKLVKPIYNTITRFKNGLKELHLETDQNSPLSINTILSRCPTLTAVKIINNRLNDRDEILPKPHTSLASLEIGGLFMKVSKIRGIIRSIPNIRHLMIGTFEIINLLPDISQHCPQLSMISNQPLAFQHIKEDILQSSSSNGEKQALQCIAFEHLYRLDSLLPLLEKGCDSLKHIYLRITSFARAEPGWRLLMSFPMPQLTELHLVDCTNSLISQIAPVIRHFPSLKTVHLENVNSRWTAQTLRMAEDIFVALLELNHLTALSLTDFDIRGQSFICLLESCAERKCLTLLSIVRCINLTPDALHIATSIQSIEFLHLTDSMYLINETDMDEFARMIENHPRLHHLKLTAVELSDKAANSIARSESLRNLFFSRVELPSNVMEVLWPKITMNYVMDDDFRWVMYR